MIISAVFGFLGGLISNLLWWAFGIALLVVVVCWIINRYFGKLALLIPGFSLISGLSLVIAGVIGAIKAAAFIMYVFTAQQQINKLKAEKAGLEQTVKSKDAEISRKQKQIDSVDTADRNSDTKYVPVYRTIEKLRIQPDLSIANRLALELTTDFYKQDEVPDAPPAN
jgi:predicted membrane protein